MYMNVCEVNVSLYTRLCNKNCSYIHLGEAVLPIKDRMISFASEPNKAFGTHFLNFGIFNYFCDSQAQAKVIEK